MKKKYIYFFITVISMIVLVLYMNHTYQYNEKTAKSVKYESTILKTWQECERICQNFALVKNDNHIENQVDEKTVTHLSRKSYQTLEVNDKIVLYRKNIFLFGNINPIGYVKTHEQNGNFSTILNAFSILAIFFGGFYILVSITLFIKFKEYKH